MLRFNKEGFTIIELLIVIVVIGLLAVLVLSNVGGVTDDARDAQRKDDVGKLASQLEIYQNQNGYYPSVANMNDFAEDGWIDSNLQLGLEAAIDPSGAGINETGGYVYTVTPVGCDNGASGECGTFVLSADLENDGRGTDDTDGTDDFVIKSTLN